MKFCYDVLEKMLPPAKLSMKEILMAKKAKMKKNSTPPKMNSDGVSKRAVSMTPKTPMDLDMKEEKEKVVKMDEVKEEKEDDSNNTDDSDDAYWARKEAQNKKKKKTVFAAFVGGTRVESARMRGSVRNYDEASKLYTILFKDGSSAELPEEEVREMVCALKEAPAADDEEEDQDMEEEEEEEEKDVYKPPKEDVDDTSSSEEEAVFDSSDDEEVVSKPPSKRSKLSAREEMASFIASDSDADSEEDVFETRKKSKVRAAASNCVICAPPLYCIAQ